MKIGSIGICSTHFSSFQQALAQLYPAGEHRITHFWGFDDPDAMEKYPELISCSTPRELIGSVDAVIITLRDGTQHYAYAKMAMLAGKPVFVDKPFTCDPKQARELERLTLETGVPCTGGSCICFKKAMVDALAQLPAAKEYMLQYRADPFSPYGGWHFYGSHTTDMCIHIFGRDWRSVSAKTDGAKISALVTYPGFTVKLHTALDIWEPILSTASQSFSLEGSDSFEAGMQHFIRVIEGREASVVSELVSSVELMNAIFTSIRTDAPVTA